MQKITFCMVLAFVGIGLIVVAIIWWKRLCGQVVIDFTTNKLLGGLALKANAFGLVVLVAFLMIIPEASIILRGYQDTIATLQAKVSNIDEVIKELKEYDLRLNLIFPENDRANPFRAKVTAYVCKKGEYKDKPYESIRVDNGYGGIVVYFDGLGLGDKLFVIVQEGNKKWKSYDMITPTVHLKMTLINHSKI